MSESINFIEEGDKFIELFKELEDVIKSKCKTVGIQTEGMKMDYLIRTLSTKNNVVKRYFDELLLIKDIRNIDSHKGNKNYRYIVSPNPETNLHLKKIINEIENPPIIFENNMYVKREKMCCKSLDDTIYDTIREMSEKIYTHIPILKDNILFGVFSENTFLDVINEKTEIIIDSNTKFSEIQEFLKIDKHSMEEFKFISKHTTVYDIEDMFKNYFKQNKRLGCVYITEHGNKNEEILGMLTAWDVLGNER